MRRYSKFDMLKPAERKRRLSFAPHTGSGGSRDGVGRRSSPSPVRYTNAEHCTTSLKFSTQVTLSVAWVAQNGVVPKFGAEATRSVA